MHVQTIVTAVKSHWRAIATDDKKVSASMKKRERSKVYDPNRKLSPRGDSLLASLKTIFEDKSTMNEKVFDSIEKVMGSVQFIRDRKDSGHTCCQRGPCSSWAIRADTKASIRNSQHTGPAEQNHRQQGSI